MRMPTFHYQWFLLPLAGVVFAALLGLPSASAQTTSDSAWFKVEAPIFKELTSNVAANILPAYSNKDCAANTKFVTTPQKLAGAQAEISRQVCAVQTAFGHQSATDNLIRLHDHSVAGPLKNSAGGNLTLQPIPNSRDALYMSGGLYGSYRYLIKNVADNITTEVQPDGTIIHRLKSGVAGVGLTDPARNLIDLTEVYFSDNAKWAVGDIHMQGMRRINLETGESLLFQSGYNHGVGTRPHFVSAISGDGRFVFTSDLSYGIVRLYDLSTCVANANPLLSANCQFRNILPLAQSQIVNFNGVRHVRFSTNHTLRLYLGKTTGQFSYLTLTAYGEKESLLDYLALGDSFASGEGAFSYKPGTDVRQPFNGCHLSTLSYPYLLGVRTALNSVQSVACSGARLQDIVSYNYSETAAQSKGRNDPSHDHEILTNYLPGYRPQVNFIDRNKPAHVTVSISGNDIGFGKIILACLAPGTCYASQQDRLNVVYTINSKFDQLVSTLESVKSGAGSGAAIYVVGYPSLADPNGNCAVNVRLDQAEIRFSNELIEYLNSVIKAAAARVGVKYIDVEQAFEGYRLCETKSSQVAVHGVTVGDDKSFSIPIGGDYTLDGYFTGRESFHPNQLGHRLLSDAIAGATNNFKSSMPTANHSTVEPSFAGANSLVGSGPYLLASRKILFKDNLVQNVIARGQTVTLTTKDLLPNSNAVLRIDSQSVTLTSPSANSNGALTSTFTIPSGLVSGFHTVHMETKNKAGEAIDVQKIVYVAATATDIDGDSVDNKDEVCLFIDPAQQDKDQDGTDDACDGFIDETPATPPTNETIANSEHSLITDMAPSTQVESSSDPNDNQTTYPETSVAESSQDTGSGSALGSMISAHLTPGPGADNQSELATKQTSKYARFDTIKTLLALSVIIIIILIATYLLLRKWRRRL